LCKRSSLSFGLGVAERASALGAVALPRLSSVRTRFDNDVIDIRWHVPGVPVIGGIAPHSAVFPV
jgi:hypothetical protein